MKKSILLILFFCVALVAQGYAQDTWGHEFERDGIYYRVINSEEGHKEVKIFDVSDNFRNKRTECVIPRTVTENKIEYTVTCIGSRIDNSYLISTLLSFSGCKKLQKITIPNTVDFIGFGAFACCEQLTTVVMSQTVDYIGEQAFLGCFKLENINLPTRITEIKDATFAFCSSLKEITIPNSVKTIGVQAFFNCQSLANITIPDGVETIENNAFYGSGIITATIGKSAKSIEPMAFCGCDKLTYITVSEQNNYYSSVDGILYNKDKTTLVRYPENRQTNNYTVLSTTKTIGKYAFYLSRLETITLPEITSIEENAFDMSYIKKLDIPYTVQSIGYDAFRECDQLQQIAIPAATTTIQLNAFKGCSNATIYCTPASKPDGWDTYWNPDNRPVEWGCNEIVVTVNNEELGSVAIKNVKNSLFKTEYNAYWFPKSGGSCTIEASLVDANLGTFNGWDDNNATSSRNITISESHIYEAFFFFGSFVSYYLEYNIIDSKKKLVEVKLNKKYTNVDNITEIEIPQTVTAKNVTYTVTKVANSGFSSTLSNLTKVSLPSTITSIGEYAFWNRAKLTTINIPENVTEIGGDAFGGCSQLSSITLPKGLKSIGESAFYDSGITSIIIPNKITTIPKSAFSECKNLSEVTMPESVTIIEKSAFRRCKALKSITIPESVQIIKYESFQGSGLESFIIKGCPLIDEYFYTFSKLHCNEYNGLKYIGDETNPYKCLVGVTDEAGQDIDGIHKDCQIIAAKAFGRYETYNTIIIPENIKKISYCGNTLQNLIVESSTLNCDGLFIPTKTYQRGKDFDHILEFPETVTNGNTTATSLMPRPIANNVSGDDIVLTFNNKVYVKNHANITLPDGYEYVDYLAIVKFSPENIIHDHRSIIACKSLLNSDITISLTSETLPYTGKAIGPEVIVKDGDKVLECGEDKDYIVYYGYNVEIGTYDIYIRGCGNLYWGTETKSYTITKATPKITPPTPIEGLVYNGELQDIATPGTTNVGKLIYSLEETFESTIALKMIYPGEYTVYYKLEDDPNINIPEVQSIKCTIAAANNNNNNNENNNNNNNDNPSTPVNEISSNNGSVKVWSYNHTIYIESAPDSQYSIIDLNGRTITTSTTKSTKDEIQINQNGIVIVVINGKAYKVSL